MWLRMNVISKGGLVLHGCTAHTKGRKQVQMGKEQFMYELWIAFHQYPTDFLNKLQVYFLRYVSTSFVWLYYMPDSQWNLAVYTS